MPFIELSKSNDQGDDLDLVLVVNTDNIVTVEFHATANVSEICLVNGEKRWVMEPPEEVLHKCK